VRTEGYQRTIAVKFCQTQLEEERCGSVRHTARHSQEKKFKRSSIDGEPHSRGKWREGKNQEGNSVFSPVQKKGDVDPCLFWKSGRWGGMSSERPNVPSKEKHDLPELSGGVKKNDRIPLSSSPTIKASGGELFLCKKEKDRMKRCGHSFKAEGERVIERRGDALRNQQDEERVLLNLLETKFDHPDVSTRQRGNQE